MYRSTTCSAIGLLQPPKAQSIRPRAIVFFDSLMGEDGDAEILAALAAHRVRIQSSVARQLRSKKTPILSFKPDDSIRAAERIERILHDKATLPPRPPSPENATDGGNGE